MKIFYFSDPQFLDMKERFENSFKEDFEREFKYIENINVDRSKPGSGTDIWKYKTEMIIEAIRKNKDTLIIVSDIDIIFYKPVIPTIMESMKDNDICFQKETKTGGINIGFIGIRCNEIVLGFWEEVYKILLASNQWDQAIVNDLIYKKNYAIKWSLFPKSIWNWSQGDLNKDLILHHANCVSDKLRKYKQMDHVSKFMSN